MSSKINNKIYPYVMWIYNELKKKSTYNMKDQTNKNGFNNG